MRSIADSSALSPTSCDGSSGTRLIWLNDMLSDEVYTFGRICGNGRPQRGKISHTHNLPVIRASLKNVLDPRLEVMTWLLIRGTAELTFTTIEAGQGKLLLRKGKICVDQ